MLLEYMQRHCTTTDDKFPPLTTRWRSKQMTVKKSSLQSGFTDLDVKFLSRETLWEEWPVVIDVSDRDIDHHGSIPWWGAVVRH